ncbi:MAG TPA: ribosome maturation factor RimM [Rhizomicrobium sp.]
MAGQSRDVLLAAVMGAQGLKGEVKVKAFTERPEALAQYGGLHTRDGRRFTVTAARAAKPGEAILALAEVADRSAAEALRGTELFVTRDALPATGEDEFYHADLIGLRAEDETGRVLGTVQAVHNYGAGDVIEIARPSADGSGGDSVLLPFTRETVPQIEIEQGRITVAVPEEVETGEHGNVE